MEEKEENFEIIVKGLAKTDYKNPAELNGVSCQDDFVEYIRWHFVSKLNYGYMSFKFEDNQLFTITRYIANEELTVGELSGLGTYTQGQWSDGIGEGFEQQACYYNKGEEFFISPWYRGQTITITQKALDA